MNQTQTEQIIANFLARKGILVTGNVFYVCSVTGSDTANTGKRPQAPVATIDYAIGLCTAAKGDVIVVLPGHAETITGAAAIALDVSGITVIGVGNGRNRPVITYGTAVAASIDITAANVRVSNIVFTPTFDNITAMVNVTAADASFDNCEFNVNLANKGAAICILTAATATRLRVENCIFSGAASNSGTTCAACIQHEAGIDYVIRNNLFQGKMTQAIKNVATVLGGFIDNNRFTIGTGTVAITMAAASTPLITNNRMNVASGTAPIVAAAGFVAGNVYSAAAGVTAGTASTI